MSSRYKSHGDELKRETRPNYSSRRDRESRPEKSDPKRVKPEHHSPPRESNSSDFKTVRGANRPNRETGGDSQRNYDHRNRDRSPRQRRENSGDAYARDRADNNRKSAAAMQRRKKGDPESFEWGKPSTSAPTIDPDESKEDKEKPSFGLSGALTADTNTFNGVVIKYNEPKEARKTRKRWRLYPVKGEAVMEPLHVHRQSAYLFGRERRVADIPTDHPSCSKQHAVFQYRMMNYTKPDGGQGKRVRPYLIDLGSANGTFINGKQIDSSRYYELFERDVIKFGFSSREFVVLHENSQPDDDSDSDVSDASPAADA